MAGLGDHRPHSTLDHRNVEDVLVQRGDGEDADESMLGGVVGVDHTDEIGIDSTMNRGRVRTLRQSNQIALTDRFGSVSMLTGIAQHTQAARFHTGCGSVAVATVDRVSAVTQQGVMAVAQPTQQGSRIPVCDGCFGIEVAGRRGDTVQPIGHGSLHATHLVGVADDLTHIGEYSTRLLFQLRDGIVGGGRVQLDVYPGFGDAGRAQPDEHSFCVPIDGENGMDHVGVFDAETREQRHDRFDQQRHVVGDDL